MFEKVISQSPLGLIIWSKSGSIKFANQAFLNFISLRSQPKNMMELSEEMEFLRELELLNLIGTTSKNRKTYTKSFSIKPDESITMDVMTNQIVVSPEKYYCSHIRPHKVNNDLSRNSLLKKQNEVLLKLAKSETIDSGDLEASVREITEAATVALDCERSSVWFYTDSNTSILSMDLFQKTISEHTNGVELFAKDFPAYFKYLGEERVLGADNAHIDINTSEFSKVYLTPLNINSMLDAPIRLHGKMIGVICNETVGKFRSWKPEELNFSASLADLISRAIEAKIRKKAEDDIKEINENLELKVFEQTKEIRESLTQITILKDLQDADYFLTSIILDPLIRNKNTSKLIETDFIVRQKKQFHFKNKECQIGGDFCITDTLFFNANKEKYVFLLNADAMGKSLQGASGAIVLGTAVLNVLWQVKNNSTLFELTPKKWLEIAILELNNIFLTFNGSMLVSGFFGLIKESSNEMLYSNFEHPEAILYRDDRASFISSKNMKSKLGAANLNTIQIESVFLRPGDVIIIGSDGKDDIELSSNQFGRSINSDETLIISLVEESSGDLVKLESLIKGRGELIDDLSLLKVKLLL